MAGPPWGDFFRVIHQGLPYKDFPQPSEGVTKRTVCRESGGIPYAGCPQITLWFLDSSVPHNYCDVHGSTAANRAEHTTQALENALYQSESYLDDILENSDEIELNLDGLDLDALINGNFSEKEEDSSNAKNKNKKNSKTVKLDKSESDSELDLESGVEAEKTAEIQQIESEQTE